MKPRYIAEGLTYSEASSLIDSLKAEGIDANITVGGVNINCDESQIEKVDSICESLGASASYMERTILADTIMKEK